MDAATFDAMLDARLAKTRAVLAAKAGEYAAPDDRLHNFKRAARMLGRTPAQACLGFLAKHLASVFDVVDGRTQTPALIDEKVGDAINYLILLEALLTEDLT